MYTLEVLIITSQAGSTEWRFIQNKGEGHGCRGMISGFSIASALTFRLFTHLQGGDYGHHMSRAACVVLKHAEAASV